MVDKLARFVKASMKGWDWAVANPDEAAMIVLENDETGAQTEKHQKRMMGEIAKLVGKSEKGTGYLDPAAYDRTVKILLAGGSDPVISKAPEGAWTHDVWEKAMAQEVELRSFFDRNPCMCPLTALSAGSRSYCIPSLAPRGRVGRGQCRSRNCKAGKKPASTN
jgi:hypothetical protein